MSDFLFDGLHHGLGATLDLRLHQQGMIASNLSNVDTPGYKAKVLRFQEALGEAFERIQEADGGFVDASALLVDELSVEDWVIDGNSVVLEKENSRMVENALMYSAVSTGLSKRLALLRFAASDGRS
jgi:flagellar basal-body rod protein FlgB